MRLPIARWIGSFLLCLLYCFAGPVQAQGFGGAPPPPPPASAQQGAPIDLTGYWVSLVTEDWRWRMLVPARGDYQSVPLNPKAYQIALSWDPAKDEASGQRCKSYGAAALMAVPERLHISWQDKNTLQVQTDAGMQTRLFYFDTSQVPTGRAPSWQGDSMASWLYFTPPVAFGAGGAGRAAARGPGAPGAASVRRIGKLKVVTSNLLPGYLRKNGIPYSAQTQLTEYWHVIKENNGTPLIVITSIVHDPVYLLNDWITALHFKQEPDGSKWDPQPCSARW